LNYRNQWKHTLLFYFVLLLFCGIYWRYCWRRTHSNSTGLILLPNLPVSTVIGTLKYLLSAELHLRLTSTWKGNDGLEIITHNGIGCVAFRFLGSTLLTYMSNDFMKPLLLFILSLLAIYCKEKFWAAYSERPF
jgi:hypothetical protein